MRVLEYIHVIKLTKGGGMVRLWSSVQGERWTEQERDEQYKSINETIRDGTMATTLIADRLSALPFCNAVEVTDEYKQGVLVYPDWP